MTRGRLDERGGVDCRPRHATLKFDEDLTNLLEYVIDRAYNNDSAPATLTSEACPLTRPVRRLTRRCVVPGRTLIAPPGYSG